MKSHRDGGPRPGARPGVPLVTITSTPKAEAATPSHCVPAQTLAQIEPRGHGHHDRALARR